MNSNNQKFTSEIIININNLKITRNLEIKIVIGNSIIKNMLPFF